MNNDGFQVVKRSKASLHRDQQRNQGVDAHRARKQEEANVKIVTLARIRALAPAEASSSVASAPVPHASQDLTPAVTLAQVRRHIAQRILASGVARQSLAALVADPQIYYTETVVRCALDDLVKSGELTGPDDKGFYWAKAVRAQ
jgi:hypothetical protein